MSEVKKQIYSGKRLTEALEVVRKTKRGDLAEKMEPYIPDQELINAVNLSIYLERPLLLMGEPGCGKSRLARAVAYELYHQEPDFAELYFEWHIKSTTKAREGLYQYDAIRRLGDAQVLKNIRARKTLDKKNYIEPGPLGKAIQLSQPGRRAVILIDEIDKADLDFPNDLLNELDRGEYAIPELGQTIRAHAKPIVIITSNQEKELPDAFLRRCIYHYINPLDADILSMILERRFYREVNKDQKDLIDKVVNQFIQIRKELNDKKLIVGKNVSTSELIDWFAAVKYYWELHHTEEKTATLAAADALSGLENLLSQAENFLQDLEAIPFRQVLFKNHNTLLNFKK